MDKRYQVFISSTFSDLEAERRGVMDALMKMDCIPAGMELFPAADEEQWAFIQKVIDDCDYYLLIIGGRYGSRTAEGISYTEKEFDYAVTIGVHVIALLHGEPDQLSAAKSELDTTARARLQAFREKVKTNRLIKYWQSGPELRAEVILSLTHAIKAHPKLGWVRGGSSSNPALLEQINELRQRNEALQKQLFALMDAKQPKSIANLAAGTSTFTIQGTYRSQNSTYKWEQTASWNQIISAVGPNILSSLPELNALSIIPRSLYTFLTNQDVHIVQLAAGVYDTIKVQLIALGYVVMNGAYWQITDLGKEVMLQTRTIKDPDSVS